MLFALKIYFVRLILLTLAKSHYCNLLHFSLWYAFVGQMLDFVCSIIEVLLGLLMGLGKLHHGDVKPTSLYIMRL